MANPKAVQPVVEKTEAPISPEVIEKMKNQVKLLHEGFVVFIKDVKSCREETDYVTVKVTLLSKINRMPVFGDVELKISRQAIPRLRAEMNKVG